MTNRNRFTLLAAFAAAAVAVVVTATPADAGCPVNKTMGTYASSGPEYYAVVVDPGVGLGSIQADYWAIGQGINGPGGVDNGLYEPDGTNGTQAWFFASPTAGQLFGGWGTNLGITDGCPKATNDPVTPGTKVALAVYDKSADGQHAYMNVTVTDVVDARRVAIDFALLGNPTMVELPKPVVTASSHSGTQRTVTLSWTAPPGLCVDSTASGQCALAITGWDIIKREKLKTDGTPDNVRTLSSWAAVGNVAVAGGGTGTQSTTVNFTCTTTTNNVAQIAIVPHLDGGFTPNYVSGGSTKIECDPTLADPGPKFKIIDKKPPTRTPAKK